MFKLFHCEARTVSNRTVGILLERFLVSSVQFEMHMYIVSLEATLMFFCTRVFE